MPSFYPYNGFIFLSVWVCDWTAPIVMRNDSIVRTYFILFFIFILRYDSKARLLLFSREKVLRMTIALSTTTPKIRNSKSDIRNPIFEIIYSYPTNSSHYSQFFPPHYPHFLSQISFPKLFRIVRYIVP